MDAWSSISRASVAAPRRVLAGAALVVLLVAPGLARLTIRTDGLALVPLEAAAVASDRELRERYAIADQIAVVIVTDDPRGIYNPATLRRIQDVSERLAALPGLAGRVTSLATEGSDRVYTGTLTARPWLDPLPATDAELARLRRDVDDVGVYDGTLVSADAARSAAAIVVDVARDKERGGLSRRIRAAVGPDGAGERTLVVGAPIAESQLGDHLLADLAVLIPLGMLLMSGIFLVIFRCWPMVLLPLAEVGIAQVLTFALMGWLGVPVYLTMAVLPVVLTMVGVTDELHVFSRLRRLLPRDADGPEPAIVVAVMDALAGPVSKAALTTAVGFLAFAASAIVPVRVFGLFMAIGVLLCMVVSLTCVPAALALIPARHLQPRGGPVALARLWHLEALGRFAVDRRGAVLGVVAVFLLLAPLGIRRLRVQDSWVGGFAPASEFRRASAEVDRLFGGTHILRIAIESVAPDAEGEIARDAIAGSSVTLAEAPAPPPTLVAASMTLALATADGRSPPPPWHGQVTAATPVDGGTRLELAGRRRAGPSDWLPTRAATVHYRLSADGRAVQPAVLARSGAFERFLAAQPTVGRVLGPAELLTATRYLAQGRRSAARRLPDDPEVLEQTLAHYRRVRGERKLREVFDSTFRGGLVTVFLRDANFADTAALMVAARDYERRELAPAGLRLRFGGDIAASQAMIEAIVGTQMWSVALSLLGIVAVLSCMLSSLAWGLACALPAVLGVLAVSATMGWAGIPLGVATSMFAATVLCIGDDYAIHLAEAARRGLQVGRAPAVALADAVATTAPAIVVDTLAVGAAFGLLCLSRVPPNARLGGLVVVSLLVCAATTLIVLPAALLWLEGATARRRRDAVAVPREH